MKFSLSTIVLIVVISLWIGSQTASIRVLRPKIKTHHVPQVRKKETTRRINIRTRGVENFRQIGTLYNGGKVLPLYGRPTYTSSSKWNYYAVTNDHIHIQVPLEINNVDCMSQNGCKELYEDDKVFIPEFGSTFVVKIYDRTPRYIPHVY
jgi:hypothetical protein